MLPPSRDCPVSYAAGMGTPASGIRAFIRTRAELGQVSHRKLAARGTGRMPFLEPGIGRMHGLFIEAGRLPRLRLLCR